VARFQFLPKEFEEILDAAAGFLFGINVCSPIILGRFAMLQLVYCLVDFLNAPVKRRAAEKLRSIREG